MTATAKRPRRCRRCGSEVLPLLDLATLRPLVGGQGGRLATSAPDVRLAVRVQVSETLTGP